MEDAISTVRSQRRIRLLWLIDSLRRGGAEKLVHTFAQQLDTERFSLTVASLSGVQDHSLQNRIADEGIPIHQLNAGGLTDRKAFRRLLALIERDRPHLIHAHLTYSDIWARLAGTVTQRPVVSTLHVKKYSSDHQSPFRCRLIESLAQFCRNRLGDEVIAVSQFLKHRYRQGGIREDRLTRIRNGINLQEFSADASAARRRIRREWEIPKEALVVCLVSVLRSDKGHHRLFEVAERVHRAFPDVVFLLVGGGPKERELRKEANRSSARIILTGHRNDVVDLLFASDIYCHLALQDALPTSVMEAMAAALPVVAFRSGGVSEMVEHQVTGLLAEEGNRNDLAEALIQILESPDRRGQMGTAGRNRCRDQFSSQRWVENLLGLYERILERRRPKQVFVVEFLGQGGMIHYAYQLCRALADTGLRVTLLTDRRYELESAYHNFEVLSIFNLWDSRPEQPGWTDKSRAKRVWSYLKHKCRRMYRSIRYYLSWIKLAFFLSRQEGGAVLFGEIRYPTDLAPLILLHWNRHALLDIGHNLSPFDTRRGSREMVRRDVLYRRAYQCIYTLFRAVFLHSTKSRAHFTALYRQPLEKVTVIPHGLEEIFREYRNLDPEDHLRIRAKLENGRPVALFFGTLTKYKGLEDLLEGFHLCSKRIPEALLIIAGFPSPEVSLPELRAQSRQFGIEDSVYFHPQYVPTEQVAEFFEIADVAVFPYRALYQSGALQVAYSLETAVVATRVGDFPSDVKEGETGLLVPPRDPAALGKALSDLLSDPSRAREMGRRAREYALRKHSWDEVASRVAQVISRDVVVRR